MFGTNQSSIDGDETTLCGDDLSRSALRHLADVRGALSNELWMDILTRHLLLYVVFEREAREFQSCHSLQYALYCHKCLTTSHSISFLQLTHSYYYSICPLITNTKLALRARTQVRKNPDALSRLLQGLQDEVNEKKCKYLKSSEELLDVISSCGIAVSGNAVALLHAILSRLDDDEDSSESLQNALRGIRVVLRTVKS